MSKKLFAAGAVLLILCAVFIVAQKKTPGATDLAGIDLSQYINPESNMFSMSFCVDFERIVKTGLLDKYIAFFNEILLTAKPEEKEGFDQGWAMFKQQMDAFGFDFKRDLKKIFVKFEGNTETDDFKVFMLINADFKQENLVNTIKGMMGESLLSEKYKNTKIYFSNENFAFTFIENKIIALSTSKEQIKGVVNAYNSKSAPKRPATRYSEIAQGLNEGKISWGYISIPKILFDELNKDENVAKYLTVFMDLDLISFSTDFDGKNYSEEFNIFMKNQKSCQLLGDAILGAKSIVKLFLAGDPSLMEMLDAMKVTQNTRNNSVTIGATFELEKMMQVAKDFMMKAIEMQKMQEWDEPQTLEGPESELPPPPAPPQN
jgi:hypothetical protein